MNSILLKDHGLIIASANKGKISEFRNYFCDLSLKVEPQPNEIDVEETGSSFVENARLKSIAASQITGQWALADDSGLSILALKGAPGIYSARYANNDQERVKKILREMDGEKNRAACFSAALCLSSPAGRVFEVEGHCNGFITDTPRGEGGFGYDPIFEVEGTGLTFAEMTVEIKRELGHRGNALELLRPKILNILSEQSSLD